METGDDFGPMESAEVPGQDEVSELKVKVTALENKLKQNEVDFGQKRARFKELYLQKEDDLKQETEKCKSAQEKVDKLEEELKNVKGELDSIKAAVAFSESNKEEEIKNIKRHYEQELASMQQLMKEVGDEASRSTAVQYENERSKLQKLNEKYEEEVQELRSKLGQDKVGQDKDGILSSLAKQIKQMAPGVGGSNSSLNQEHENLEDSMKKAQADAEMLKSVVVPLEEEISTLKYQLQCAQEKIQELQNGGGNGSSPSQRQMTPDTQSLSDLDPDERIKELLKYLQAEKASRKDLEMYVAVLSTQKNVIQEEADRNKTDLDEVCNILEEEKKAHEDLRQTWQMANDQFLESQRLMMMDLQRMESVLSAEQQRQIAEMQKKDQEREAQEKKVKVLEEMRMKQQKEQEERRKQDALKKVGEASEKLKAAQSPTLQKSHSNSIQSNESGEDMSSNSDLMLTRKSLSVETLDRTQEGDSFLDSQVEGNYEDGLRVQISPEKTIHMPHLSETQLKSLTDPTPELEARQSMMATAKRTESRVSLEGRRMVSENEWSLMQQQLKEARAKLGRPCDMCNNYEAQLQNVQDDLKKERVKAKSFERQLNSEIQTAENRQKYVEELESSVKEKAEDAEKQILSLCTQLEVCEKYIGDVRQQYTSSQVDLQSDLKTLTAEREKVQKELTKLQEENDSLVGKHSKNAQQLQNEDINLPNNMEEMQMLLLRYREEIIQAKVALEHTEETLKSEIMFLKSQVQAEQQEKTTLEETLTQDISNLQEKLVMQESLKSELERESSVRAETESKLRETDQSLKSIQAKSKQLITALQQQVEEQSNARTKLETEVQKYKNKVQSLQIDLDNSEAVQRDFVKLSQSLQIQLEKIRQAETEVRWQHEEDVEECTNCKLSFSVTKRKHHCKHCGKIFCAECTSKLVTSGPHFRQSKVCDVCHTILVKDAMPYFSTDPPNTPD